MAVRLRDWKDVHAHLEEGQPFLKEQAGRCMDCGIPFCHQGCPLGNLIPEWNDLVYREQWADAIDRLHETNNFPEFTGRVCPAPCESSCVLGINQPPVTIKNVEVSIIDEAFERGYVTPQVPQRLTGFTVAVVGSGPAGLAAAQQLTRAGHTVAVYERDDAVGGLLRYGIPDFKLEKHHIDRRVAQMEAEGTRFRPGVEIGVDITWDDLRARYDAVVVATGATVPRDLSVPGRELGGIHYAMDFLHQANAVVAGREVPDQITATGKHVIVIGGGDTGSDCLGTSLRQGAASVTTLAIGKQPPLERSATQPWPTDPIVFEVSSSHEEGGEREFLASTVAFLGDENGVVRAARRGDRVPARRPSRAQGGHRARDPRGPRARRDGLHGAGDGCPHDPDGRGPHGARPRGARRRLRVVAARGLRGRRRRSWQSLIVGRSPRGGRRRHPSTPTFREGPSCPRPCARTPCPCALDVHPDVGCPAPGR